MRARCREWRPLGKVRAERVRLGPELGDPPAGLRPRTAPIARRRLPQRGGPAQRLLSSCSDRQASRISKRGHTFRASGPHRGDARTVDDRGRFGRARLGRRSSRADRVFVEAGDR